MLEFSRFPLQSSWPTPPCDVEPADDTNVVRLTRSSRAKPDSASKMRTPFAYTPEPTPEAEAAFLTGRVPTHPPLTRGELIFGLAVLAVAVVGLLVAGGLN